MSGITFAKALDEGLRRAMERDPKVVLMGEDIGRLGGVFRITDGLQKDFGERRVLDTPLAESGIVGTAVGLAYRGYRPVVEIQFDGFVYPAFDQIVAQVAKLHYRTRGTVAMPLTIRIPFGGGIGSPEHHSEAPEAYFAHTAGLRVVSPSNPQEAFTMIQQAIASGPCGVLRAQASLPRHRRRGPGHRARHGPAACPWARPGWCVRAPTPPSSSTGRWSRRPWTPPPPPRMRASASR